MRSNEEICSCTRLMVNYLGIDGGNGVIHIGNWEGSVIWSNGGGWDHVSVSPFKRRIVPSWDDMCRIKEIFFRDDEAVIEIHPPKDEYVNQVENCLHLWRTDDMKLPPSWMIGCKKGESILEVMGRAAKELEEYEHGKNQCSV